MNKSKILVADDDRSICTLIKIILEKEGFDVSCLYDGESVVKEIGAEDKIEAYESRADDYLCKPFSSIELVLRVKALLKRTKTEYTNEIEFLHAEKSIVI